MEQLLSVIVPVYNGERTISRCIKSILASTWDTLEVLVVDDGSTDGTAAIVKALAAEDPRVILISTDNGGVARARNMGLSRSKGQFIGFVDADDHISPDMYRTMIGHMPEDCDMVVCGSYHCHSDGSIAERNTKPVAGYKKSCPREALDSVIYERTTMAVWSKLFRSSRIKNPDGSLAVSFRQDMVNYEDLVFVSEYLSRCGGYMELIPFRLYYYCFSQGSLSGKTVPPDNLKTSLTYLTDLCGQFPEGELAAPKLFYMETFLKYWYIQLIRHKEYRSPGDIPQNALLLDEIRRYYDLYKSSPAVAAYKKAAAAMLLNHPALTFSLVKAVRRFVRL